MVNSGRSGRSGPGRGTPARTRSSRAGASGRSRKGNDAQQRRSAADPSQQQPARPQAEQQTSPKPTSQRSSAAGRSDGKRARNRRRRRYGLTTRAIALAVVLLVLMISYASSLRVYFKQRHDIAETKSAITHSQKHIDQLHNEIDRWHDDDYVRIQARQRLGWVQPGETGYRVVGSDGKPVTKNAGVADEPDSDTTSKSAWYDKLWGSVKHADHPPKHDSDAKHTKNPITKNTKPNSGG